MNKNLLLIFLVLCCGVVQAQETDSLITNTGRVIMCKVTKIENDKIYFQRNGPDWTKEIKDVAELIIDKQSTKRKMNASEIDSIFHSKRQTPDSLLIKIRQKKNKLEDLGYFRQTIKINPLSFINEYTLKYLYRFNYRLGMQLEAGYLHRINGRMESRHSPFEHFASPFAWRGVVARAGVRYYLLNYSGDYQKSLSLNLFYKNQEHGKIALLDVGNGDTFSEKRTVYGINLLFSKEKYVGNFLVEFYAGISVRIMYRETTTYSTNTAFGLTTYDPPKYASYNVVLPAIQGGINIGFGFNGKKKKE